MVIVLRTRKDKMRVLEQNTFKVAKEKILETLRSNKEKHISEFEEATKEYRKAVAETAQKIAERAKNEDIPFDRLGIEKLHALNVPFCMTKQYDNAIVLLETCEDQTLEITGAQFRQLMLDEWDWKLRFSEINSAYTTPR